MYAFAKKCDGHKHYAKSRSESSFDRFFQHRLRNSKYWSFPVEFRSVFHTLSWKFKILAIHDVLAHGKSYKHSLAKKCDGHKHYAKSCPESSFDRFFLHRLGNSKYWSFPSY
ncbi:hypothetical protein BHM03_00062277 [Ensete ventricosum]|nr:hypothetical protein BHM03_00062277 [Ensete ventricosum]